MKTIVLKPILHKNAAQIGIYFDYDDEVRKYVKAFEGVRWSQTHGVFMCFTVLLI